MKHRILAAVGVVLDVVRLPQVVAYEWQGALLEQKRLDLWEKVQCQACGGLGVVEDYANRWYECRDPSHHHGDLRWDLDPQACDSTEMVYGGKRCPSCGGRGAPAP